MSKERDLFLAELFKRKSGITTVEGDPKVYISNNEAIIRSLVSSMYEYFCEFDELFAKIINEDDLYQDACLTICEVFSSYRQQDYPLARWKYLSACCKNRMHEINRRFRTNKMQKKCELLLAESES